MPILAQNQFNDDSVVRFGARDYDPGWREPVLGLCDCFATGFVNFVDVTGLLYKCTKGNWLTYHEYLCTDPTPYDSNPRCYGFGPRGFSLWDWARSNAARRNYWVPGGNNWGDSYDEKSCNKIVSDNACLSVCIAVKHTQLPKWYSLNTYNCRHWAAETANKCLQTCGYSGIITYPLSPTSIPVPLGGYNN